MRTLLQRILDVPHPEGATPVEEILRMRRVRTLQGVLLALLAAVPPSIHLYLSLGAPGLAAAVAAGAAVAVGIFFGLRRGLSVERAGHATALTLQLLLFFLGLHLGGLEAPSSGWLVVPLLLAGLVLGPRGVLLYGTTMVLQVALMAILDRESLLPPSALTPEVLGVYTVTTQIALTVATGACVLSFLGWQRRSERALRKEEARTRAILGSSLDAIVVCDGHGVIESVNARAESLFGWCDAELRGRAVDELIPARLRSAEPGALQRFLREQGERAVGSRVEILVEHRSGAEIPVELSVGTFEIDGVTYYTGFLHDVSVRRRTQQDLRASEARFRAMLDASPFGVFMNGPDGACHYTNVTCQAILRRSAAECLGYGWAEAIHPDDREEVVTRWTRTVASGETSPLVYRILGPDGAIAWVSARAARVFDGDVVLGYVGTVEDVTQRRLAEASLQRSYAELAEARDQALAATRAKSDFLATVSHEIRTPMNGVLGAATLLADTPLSAEQAEYARIVRTCAEGLLVIVNDILDFSKIEAGRIQIERVGFDLHLAVQEVMALLLPRAAEKGLALEAAIAADVPKRVLGDPARFRQVLLNLAGNALKFTERGRIGLDVACEGFADDCARIVVAVTDTGIGVAPDALPRLFERFHQADASTTRRFGGTGLGLAISKQLVGLMGGEIGAESRPGEGSRFWFRLPLAPDSKREPEVVPVPGGAKTRDLAGLHVLLAEDNAVNQTIARRFLEKLGCRVDVAADGREAVTRSNATRYDAILMDCQMPVMDGYAATSEIRRIESGLGRRTPIIALTANAMVQDRAACLEAGMDDYVPKPVSMEALSAALQRFRG